MNNVADNLFPHNREAYEAVMRHYAEGNTRAAVVQPTGTGKAYVGGAVASHFKKVLVVAPNEHVLYQASETAPHAELKTYAWLSQQAVMPTGYDLIWFDEFHRIGAETWQKGVEALIDANTEAKVLGTTATPERHLEQRNMADEFFSGDVVSEMYLPEAWAREILKVPTYIIGVISMDDVQKDYEQKIKSAKRLNKEQKDKANAMLDNLIRDWSASSGVPRILSKYLDKDVRKMVVFAQTIDKIDEIREILPQWFREAGIPLGNVYVVHSALGTDAVKELDKFRNDNGENLSVLISVDMLNEGIHPKDVDAVMMLRSTISMNLYLQQMGRGFSVGQNHKPIVFDLADNITSAGGYNGIYEARERFIRQAGEYCNGEEYEKRCDSFSIIDTLKSTRELIAVLDKQTCLRQDFFDRLAEFDAYVRENGGFPPVGHPLRTFACNSCCKEKYRQYMLERGFDITPQRDRQEMRAYLMEHRSIPSYVENTNLRTSLMVYMRAVVREGSDTELIEVINSLGIDINRRTVEYNISKQKNILRQYVEIYRRFPTKYTQVGTEQELQGAINAFRYVKQKDAEYIVTIAKELNIPAPWNFKRRKFEEKIDLLKKYNGCPNGQSDIQEEKTVANWLYKMRHSPLEDWQREAIEATGATLEHQDSTTKSIRRANEFIAYVKEHGKLPPYNHTLIQWYKNFTNNASHDSEAYKILVQNNLHVYEKQKIHDYDTRLDIIAKYLNNEDVKFAENTMREWIRQISKKGTDEQKRRIKEMGFVVRKIMMEGLNETCQQLDEYLTETNIKVIHMKDNPLSRKLCRIMSGENGTDEHRTALQAILDRHGAKVYTFESQWLDNFHECYALMQRTGFYPRKRIPEEKRLHDWLISVTKSNYPSVLKHKHLIYEHNMLMAAEKKGGRQGDVPWEDKPILPSTPLSSVRDIIFR